MEKVVAKVKDVAKVSELKLRIVEKEATKEGLMSKLGKEVYETYPALNVETLNNMVGEINKLNEEITTLNDAIIAIKGMQKCPKCGSVVKDSMKYCSECGTKLEKEEPPVEEEAETEETEIPVEEE